MRKGREDRVNTRGTQPGRMKESCLLSRGTEERERERAEGREGRRSGGRGKGTEERKRERGGGKRRKKEGRREEKEGGGEGGAKEKRGEGKKMGRGSEGRKKKRPFLEGKGRWFVKLKYDFLS